MPGHPIVASLYDRVLAGAERAGLAEMRARLLSQASGRTLELGAGTGLNLAHYPEAVTELVLTEPDPHMARRMREKIDREREDAERPVEVVSAPAEQLPFDDSSFQTVVGTLVLCTVEDPGKAIAEIRRVLEPGGQLLFLEHIRSDSERAARWQDRLERPWGWIAGGCHPNRETDQLLGGGSLWIERMERGTMPRGLPLIRPIISGVARRPTTVEQGGETY